VEHQEVPKEETAVKSSGVWKKWHKGQNLAAERCCQDEGWDPEESGSRPQRDDPPRESGTAQRKHLQEKLDQGQRGMRNLEKMEVQEEVSAKTGMQKWDKEQMPEIAATKQKGIHQDLQENHWTGDRKANYQIFCWVVDNQE
jgi:hypothetical protein